MKKITSLVVLLIVIGTTAFASSGPLGENSTFKIIPKTDKKFELVYVSSEVSDVRIYIIDQDGSTVETNIVKDATKFRRTFDFNQMGPGKYSVIVKNTEGTAREEIYHPPYKTKLQTFVAKVPNSKSLKLHVGDFNNEEPVHVKIYNEKNEVIHKDKITNEKAFSKIYNLQKATPGQYFVSIANDGQVKSFFHEIKE
jgi:hypothetical protein